MRKGAQLGLFFLYVLQVEAAASGWLSYVASPGYEFWLPLLIFGGIALGSGLALWPPLARASADADFHVLLFSLIGSLVCLRLAPETWPFAALLIFAAIGLQMTGLYARVALWDLVRAFALAGLIFYTTLWIAPDLWAAHAFTAILIGLAALGVLQAPKWQARLLPIAACSVLFLFWQRGDFRMRPRTMERSEILEGAQLVGAPRYSNLFRTDLLYMPKNNVFALVANGRRFMRVPGGGRVDKPVRGVAPFNWVFDTPYAFVKNPRRVLVLGAGEGANVLAALQARAPDVWAVDMNASVFDYSLHELADYTSHFYERPQIVRFVDEGRHFLETHDDKFDVIVLQGLQTDVQAGVGNIAAIESFLFTQEALRTMWSHLTEHGVIAFEEICWPGRSKPTSDRCADSLLTTVAANARRALTLSAPEKQIRLISHAQKYQDPRQTLLIAKDELADADVNVLLAQNTGGSLSAVPEKVSARLTDARPNAPLRHTRTLLLLLAATLVALLLGIVWFGRKSLAMKEGFALTTIGALFIVFATMLTGPATLILGRPMLLVPVLYGGMLGGSLFGAWLALQKRVRLRLWEALALVAFLALLSFALPYLRVALISVVGVGPRLLTVFTIAFIFAALLELPYMRLLAECEGPARARRFFLENAGTLIGGALALLLQLSCGYQVGMIVATALAVVLALTLFRRTT